MGQVLHGCATAAPGATVQVIAPIVRCPRHAVRLCHGLWRGARALSGRPMLTKPFQMDGPKQMLQSALR